MEHLAPILSCGLGGWGAHPKSPKQQRICKKKIESVSHQQTAKVQQGFGQSLQVGDCGESISEDKLGIETHA